MLTSDIRAKPAVPFGGKYRIIDFVLTNFFHSGIKRLYDVAAVDIPAYDATSISARSFYSAEAEREAAEAVKRERQKRKIKILMEVMKNDYD